MSPLRAVLRAQEVSVQRKRRKMPRQQIEADGRHVKLHTRCAGGTGLPPGAHRQPPSLTRMDVL